MIRVILLALIFIGLAVLQGFLAKSGRKWASMILPGIYFTLSLIAVLGVAPTPDMGAIQLVLLVFFTLLLYNIPTMILLAIYFAFRPKERKQKELEKMRLQDLD